MKFSKSLLLLTLFAASLVLVLTMRLARKPLSTDKLHEPSPIHVTGSAANPDKLLPTAPKKQPQAAKTTPAIPPALGQFGVWAAKYGKAATDQERATILPEGEALAKARREQLKRVMQENPALALQQLVPYSLRKQLPDSIKQYLEQPVSGRGKLSLIQSTPLPDGETEGPDDWYKAELNRRVYRAYLAGQKPMKTVNGIALVGAAIDNMLALNAVPPVLEEAQVADLVQEGKIPKETICSVSGNLTSTPVVVDAGGIYRTFCTARHAQQFQVQYAYAASALDASAVADTAVAAGLFSSNLPPAVFGTLGRQKLLVIPVAYADDPRAPQSQDAIIAGVLSNNRYYEDGSYGTVSFISTVTPLLTLPQRKTYYGEFLDSDLWIDAVTVAQAAGYFSSDYDYIYVIFNPIPGVSFGGRSDGLLQGGIGAISHELGHNFGLAHANYWNVDKAGPPAIEKRLTRYGLSIRPGQRRRSLRRECSLPVWNQRYPGSGVRKSLRRDGQWRRPL